MKKSLFLISFLSLSLTGWGQAQRQVLMEEFTQASCGPCAAQNPAYNALLQANPSKVVVLKYQTSWPGYDPMNLQNPTEVANRVSYYGINGVPSVQIDGSIQPTGASYAGAPANVTQSMISNQYAVSSDFTLTVTHTLSNDLDSATVTVTVTNATSSTVTSGSTGSFKLRLAAVEKEINFPFAPGTNGETEFYGVMRKMYPNAGGTALSDSWTAAATQTFTFKVALPSYIYNYEEVAFVAFIQDDSNKDVLQSAFSQPVALPATAVDVSLANNTQAPADYCATSVTPEAVVTNETSQIINSVDINLMVNGTVAQTKNYTTAIGANGNATISFPALTINPGSNNISFEITGVNGAADYNKLNNLDPGVAVNIIDPTVHPFPVTTDFESTTTFTVPTDLVVEDETGRLYVIDASVTSPPLPFPPGGYGQSAKSFRWDFATIAPGTVSSIITQKVSLQGGKNSEVQFDIAYALRGSITGDKFAAYISTDCGATWVKMYEEVGGGVGPLETAPATASNARFYPLSANVWKSVSASIPAADGTTGAIFKFEGTSAGGNALYFDNLMVDGKPIGISEYNTSKASIYPNPATNQFFVDMGEATNFTVKVTNSIGQTVKVLDFSKTAKAEINTSDLAKGIYIVTISSDKGTSSERITIAK